MHMLKIARILSLAVILSGFATASNAQIFGYDEVKHSDIKEFAKWEGVLNKFNYELARNDAGLQAMRSGLSKIAGMQSSNDKIKAVNNYVNNSIAYSPDSMIYGKSDYWAAPGETFARGEGDCDDFAIAKFFALRMLGFNENDMRIVILRDSRKNEIHAVLSIKHNGRNYILDNQSEYVVEDTQITYYTPIYSIAENGYWTHS